VETRRVRDGEGDAVGHLWDRMCREVPDGGPLTEQGRRNLSRLLDVSAWHRDVFCLVAVEGGEIVGFVNGRVDTEDGLLPGQMGWIESLYVLPAWRGKGISRTLAEAAIAWLRERGAHTLRHQSCVDATDDHEFWQSLGFETDMVCLSSYLQQ
jgi:GNAT superfamily N-acetyltransferase